MVLPGDGLASIYTFLPNGKAYTNVLDPTTGSVIGKELDLANSIYIDWGLFISAIINFLLIALVLFIIVKFINQVSSSKELLKTNVNKARTKQTNGKKLTKKEIQLLLEDDARIAAELEAKKIAEAEANKPKITTESLLQEIRDLLANKN